MRRAPFRNGPPTARRPERQRCPDRAGAPAAPHPPKPPSTPHLSMNPSPPDRWCRNNLLQRYTHLCQFCVKRRATFIPIGRSEVGQSEVSRAQHGRAPGRGRVQRHEPGRGRTNQVMGRGTYTRLWRKRAAGAEVACGRGRCAPGSGAGARPSHGPWPSHAVGTGVRAQRRCYGRRSMSSIRYPSGSRTKHRSDPPSRTRYGGFSGSIPFTASAASVCSMSATPRAMCP